MPLSEQHRLSQAIMNAAVRRMVDEITKPNPLVELLRRNHPYVPPTRWQRIKRRLRDYRERIVLAWRVLRGDDIHEDCD